MAGSTPNESSPLFAEGGHGTLRLVAYLALAGILMVADHRGRYLDGFRAAAARLTGPIYTVAEAPAKLAAATRLAIADRRDLMQENSELRDQLLLAQARLARLGAVQDQNARLRELLDARTKLGLKAQRAELVDVDLDPFRHRRLLDLGSDDGIARGQAVIDARGVMGQVLDVQPHRATLILITDPGHALPVRVVRSGLRTIAYGTGDVATLRLPHIPFSADVRPGDALVTSGVGGKFPAGLPVGVVREVSPDDSATFILALATPSAGLARSGEVLVLHDERELLHAPGGPEIEFVGPPEELPVLAPAPGPAGGAAGGEGGQP